MYDSEFWKDFINRHYQLLEKIVQTRFKVNFRLDEKALSGEQSRNMEMAEEARSFVCEKLAEDDYRRLRNYDPARGAKPETYFNALVKRLLSKFFEETKGRYKPPKWLLRQDNFLLTLIHKHLCWEKMPEHDVTEYLRTSAFGNRNPSFIREAIQIIQDKYPDCGESAPPEIENADPADSVTPETQLIRKEKQKIIRAILLGPDDDASPSVFPVIRTIQENIRQQFNPTKEQRLFLRMIYQDGIGIADTGKKLGWTKYKAQGQIKSLRKKLRQIAGSDLERLFGDDL